MKTYVRAAAIAAAVLVGGCSTVERTSPGIMQKFDVVGSGVLRPRGGRSGKVT